MVRPLSRPDNIQQRGCKLNGQVAALTHDIPYSNLFEKNEHFRQIAMLCFKKQSKKIFGGLAYLDEAEKTDIIASLFILILQIYGRLARVTNLSNHPPNIYFVDGAWRPSEANPNGFNCLNELYRYLDTLIKDPVHAEIAQALYYPFYVAFQKGIEHA